jgi:uncharacterized repeat protein (TIGR01451 family)
MYQDQVNNSYPYVVQNSGNWIYAGSGFVDGSKVPSVVGYEYDKVFNNGASPPGLTVLSNSPVVGVSEGSGNSFSNSTLYTAPSGAMVFGGGTIQWSWGLDNYAGGTPNAGFQRTTANILDRFIQGTGTPTPAVSLSPSSLAFGNQLVNTTSSTRSSTLTNSGNAPLTISSIGMTGANGSDFVQSNDCPIAPATLAAGATCTLNVSFTPAAIGARNAAVQVTDDASGTPHSLALSGTGQAPGPAVTLSPTSLAFGTRGTGQTSPAQTVTLSNTGNGPLTISSIDLAGTNPGDFAQTTTCPAAPDTLAAGASCTASVTFTPTAGGTRSASLRFTDDAPTSPQSVSLGGSGTAPVPKVTLSATSLAFGSEVLGVPTAAKTTTLTNSGTGPLTIASASLVAGGSDYAIRSDSCSGATVAVGATCMVTSVFNPSATGSRPGTLRFSDNAANSPQSVALSGTGQTAELSMALTANKTSVARNGTINFVATITNSGPGKAQGVRLTEAIPAGATFRSATFGTGVSCTLPPVNGTGDVVCKPNNALESINSAATMRVTIVVNAVGASGSMVADTASLSTPAGSAYDLNATNNSQSVSVRIN